MKKWYESKLVWVNTITMLVLMLEAVKAVDLLTQDQMVYVGLAVTFLNIILRVWFTETKLTK